MNEVETSRVVRGELLDNRGQLDLEFLRAMVSTSAGLSEEDRGRTHVCAPVGTREAQEPHLVLARHVESSTLSNSVVMVQKGEAVSECSSKCARRGSCVWREGNEEAAANSFDAGICMEIGELRRG